MPNTADYMREWRRQRPEYKLITKAYTRALERLKKAHPDEFRVYLVAERTALGLPGIPDKSENAKKPKRRLDPAQFDGSPRDA